MSRARPASTFEEITTREAALRILFPAEAGDMPRARPARRWLARFPLSAIRAAITGILTDEPWRAEWE